MRFLQPGLYSFMEYAGNVMNSNFWWQQQAQIRPARGELGMSFRSTSLYSNLLVKALKRFSSKPSRKQNGDYSSQGYLKTRPGD